jgi:hypothetical protein
MTVRDPSSYIVRNITVYMRQLLTVPVPGKEAIQYERRRLWRDIDGPNPFVGKPRPAFDEAWHNIIERMMFAPYLVWKSTDSFVA